MSVRKELYNALASKLEQVGIKTVDLYKGQLSGANEDYPTNFPAGYISISNIKWEDMTMGAKEGNAFVKIYLFFNKGGDTFIGAADKEETLKILDTQEDVIEEIEGIEGNLFTPLSQTDEDDQTERYKRPTYIITFETLAYKRIKKLGYVLN